MKYGFFRYIQAYLHLFFCMILRIYLSHISFSPLSVVSAYTLRVSLVHIHSSSAQSHTRIISRV
jgi:hypothetical protein